MTKLLVVVDMQKDFVGGVLGIFGAKRFAIERDTIVEKMCKK